RTFRDVMNGAPEELSLACAFLHPPAGVENFPPHLTGQELVAVLGMWAGSLADGERALAPIRALGPDADLFGPTPYADFQRSLDDPPGFRNYWTAESVTDLPEEAIELIVTRSHELSPGASMLFIV